MANLKSAKKRALQNRKRHANNQARRSEIKSLTKKFMEAIDAKDIDTAREMLVLTESAVSRAKGKRVVKRNTASRKVSTLAKRLSALQKKNA